MRKFDRLYVDGEVIPLAEEYVAPELGNFVRDRVTGSEGQVTGITKYLHWPNSCLVEGRDSTGRATSDWFPEKRLSVIGHSGAA